MKRWMIGGCAIALLTGFPALGQPAPTWLNQPQYQPQYQTQYRHQPQYQYQPRYLPQAPVLQVTPSSATIQIYLASPYSNRSRYVAAPYRQSGSAYPAAPTYHYPTPTYSTSIYRGISVPLRFVKRSLRESRFSQPYSRQTIYPVRYPIGNQDYPFYGAPYRR